jgi:hypothetical protein
MTLHSLNIIGAVVLICGSLVMARDHRTVTTIPANSAIFIDSNNGFDIFIAAALQSKGVPLRLVASIDRADYVMDSSLFHYEVSAAVETRKLGIATSGLTSSAAFKLTSRAGDIVWAYEVTKGMLSRGKQSVAEACAKHLKEAVDK